MAIRKDLDDMLNNLTKGKPAQKPAPQPEKKQAVPQKKSVYDSMSVDDILSALTEEKKPGLAENIINELEEKKAVREAEEAKKAEEIKKASEPVPEEEKALPKKKKKKIVITGELPDYEAIRRQELEKMELERRKNAPEPVKVTEPEEEPVKIFEPVPEPIKVIEPEPVKVAEPEPEVIEELVVEEPEPAAAEEEIIPEAEALAGEIIAPEAENIVSEEEAETEAVPEEKADDEEMTEEKPKKGFFSKFRKKRSEEPEEEINEPEVTPEAEEVPEETFDEEVKIDDLFTIEEVEDDPEMAEEEAPAEVVEDEQPEEEEIILEEEEIIPEEEIIADDAFTLNEEESNKAVELIDAALAAINEEALTPDEENDEEEAAEEETDSVEEMIDGIREDAANAIAEIEESAEEEKAPETEEAAAEEAAVEETAEEKPKKESKVTKALNNILDESPEALIAVKNEKVEADEDEAPRKKSKFKKRLYTVLGVVFTIFAIIGVAATAVKGVKMVKSFTSGEVKKDGFTEVLYPMVIMDIESFNAPSELTSEQIITASIWSIIMNDEKISKYELNPGGDTVSISSYDVEAQAVELFGENLPEFEHTTLGPVESRFYFDTDRGVYNVKVNPIVFTYQPEIKTIVKNGSDYVVTVDYIDEMPAWIEKSVSKSVEYSITEKNDGTYRINSMNILYIKSTNV